MLRRRLLAVVAGLALVAGAVAIRSGDDGGDGDGPSRHERERAAEVADLQEASAEELRRLAERGSGYDLAFQPGYEELPTLTCSADLGDVCGQLAGLGFDVTVADPWATFDRSRDGGPGTDVWVGPRALLDGTPDVGLEVEGSDLAGSLVAATTRRGPGPAEECEGSGTPLTCLVEAADRVTMPDPTTSAAGAAVLVALAHETGGSGPEHLAAAAEVLSDAQVTAAPIPELLDVDLPRGEVALGTDAPVVAESETALDDDEPPPVHVRWARTTDSLPITAAIDPDHPQAERIQALLGSSTVEYDFRRAGFLPVIGDAYVDPEGPLAERPATGAPVPLDQLEAARELWRSRS